jgi:cytochrome c oxidase subunit 2
MRTPLSTAFGIALVFVLMGQGCPMGKQTKKTDVQTTATVVQETNDIVAAPSITAENQTLTNGSVVIASVTALEPSWVVIHTDAAGKPGPVIGQGYVAAGTQNNISIEIDALKATPRLFAMLHVDKGVMGTYEFPGDDVPVTVDNQVVVVPFTTTIEAQATIKTHVEAAVTIPEIKSFSLTAKKWEFSPSSITVNKGDTVKLSIKSIDVTHGFSLPDFNVNATLKPNETTEVTFIADKTGTFSFFCSVFCGAGHTDMNGTLIVK